MELKGKTLTLAAKIVAALFVLLCFGLITVFGFNIEIDNVIKIGIFIALLFSPVDVSLWLQTFFSGLSNTRNKTFPDDGKSEPLNG